MRNFWLLMLSAFFFCVQIPQVLAVSFSDFSILAENDVTIGQNAIIEGNTGSNSGNVDVGSGAILGSIFGGGSVQSVGTSAIVLGKVVSNGLTDLGPSVIITDSLNSGGAATIGPGANISSDVTSAGTTQIDPNVFIGGNLLSGSDLTVDANSSIQGNAGVNGNVTVNNGASIVGHVTHSGTLTLNGSGSVGSESTGPSVVNPESFPGAALPPANIFTAGGSDITTVGNQTTTLLPGTYGTLDLGASNILNLTAGSYFFDAIDIGNNLDFNIDLTGGNLLLYILGDADFGQGLDVFLTNGDAFNIFIETHGNWEAAGNWYGTVLAPFGDITLGQDSIAFGAFYSGDQIDIQQGVSLTFQLSPLTTPTTVPEPATCFLFGFGLLSFFLKKEKNLIQT